jgi:DNA-binding winged helix-turn-helix (wHTH) protein
VLAAHAGELVSKEALLATVWSGTIVSDDSLISCIQELRKALGDDPKNPRFIETRHRRGYRFIPRTGLYSIGIGRRARAGRRRQTHRRGAAVREHQR